jgi:hypothetical protein
MNLSQEADRDLQEHIKKAVNDDDTAPKQKHVRGKQFYHGIIQRVFSLPMIIEQVNLFGFI